MQIIQKIVIFTKTFINEKAIYIIYRRSFFSFMQKNISLYL